MIILWKEFIPLSISDVTMAFGDPMVNGTIAQLPKLQTNLSALGVIRALVILFESPIIMILHASNRLSTNKESRLALKKFVLLSSGILTLFLSILAIPSVFFPLMQNIINLTPDVSQHAHKMFLCLLLWPAAIAIRRYYQGILIIHKQLHLVAKAGLLRMAVLGLCLVIGYYFNIHATYLAGGSMMAAAIAESIAVFFSSRQYCNSEISEDKIENEQKKYPKTIKEIWKFYWPLANSMVVVWSGRALLVVCLARAVDSSIALAVWPATWALVVLFANSTRMIQQVIIRNQKTFHPSEFILFSCTVGVSLTILLFGLGFSNFGHHILTYFVGENEALLTSMQKVLYICACIPLLVAVQNVLQGFLMCLSNTKAINMATLWGVFALLVCASVGVTQNFHGAQVAAYSMLVSLLIEVSLLAYQVPWKLYTSEYFQHQKFQEGTM